MAKKMAVIIIEDWMISEAHLSGLELLAFALIHGCTQKGDGCWYGGYDRMAARIGGKQRGTIVVVKKLTEYGAIESFDAVIDGKQRKAFRSLWDSAKFAEPTNEVADNADAQNAEGGLQKMQSSSAQNAELSHSKERNIKKFSEAVERIYALYPSSTIRKEGNSVMLKSASVNKTKIASLLKTEYTEESLSYAIRRYVSETNPYYLKAFSTFLNQVPDYSSQQEQAPSEQPAPQQPQRETKVDPELRSYFASLYKK